MTMNSPQWRRLTRLARYARAANVAALPELERSVVILRLGWDIPQKGPRNQGDVAKELGLSQTYVSEIERRAVKALEDMGAI